jgi:hypothetical protein
MAKVVRNVIHEVASWEVDAIENMRPVADDPFCWLKGAFPPTVRQPYGELPSGNLVMPLGDTAITFDPIGGQGGNCASRNARFIADAVIARGDDRFDATWMTKVNHDFWDHHGRAAYTFNNILLEPLTEAGQTVLMHAAQDRAFADKHFFGNFSSPNGFFPWIEDLDAARRIVSEDAA